MPAWGQCQRTGLMHQHDLGVLVAISVTVALLRRAEVRRQEQG
jgi:hypothetical protein